MSLNQIADLNQANQKGYEWLLLVGDALDITDRNRTYMLTRAVLHAVRDRLTVEEAHQLAAQLPLIWKGIFFDGYKPAGKPIKFKTKEEFLERIKAGDGKQITNEEAIDAAEAVITVLETTVSEGEMDDVMQEMPKRLRELFF